MSPPVVIEGRDRAAWDAPAALPPGAFLQAADGQILRVEADGHLEVLLHAGLPWHKGVASAPSARRDTLRNTAHPAGPRPANARKPGQRSQPGAGGELLSPEGRP